MIIPVILCGGSGSRLWPVSRETHPKPFIRMNDGVSLLQKAFLRGVALPDVAEILTVTNAELLTQTTSEYKQVNALNVSTRFVLEPFGRNTAAAVAMASLLAQRTHGKHAVLLVLPADHLITDQAAFCQAVVAATQLAETGKIVTFGIRPTSAETGFGYIEADGNTVKRFVEKPDRATAEAYVASGTYLWNAGMFCFNAESMLAEMRALCPDILDSASACLVASLGASSGSDSTLALDRDSFALVRSESIDYAVMEKTQHAAVVACDIGWSDIGSWNAIASLTQPDADGNRVVGEALMENTRNCYIESAHRLVGTVGLDNLVIVDTPDALLVARNDKTQDVKKLYTRLQAAGHETYKLHRTVHRPWGTYTVLEEGPFFKIKRIEVNPKASLSLQMHHHRSEHWIVVSGTAKVVNGEQEMLLRTNESTYIPAGHVHRLSNPGIIPLQMIEVQSGQYLGEDDIVRFSDQYGRDVLPLG